MKPEIQITDHKKSVEDGLENFAANLGTNQDKRHLSRYVNTKRLSARGNERELLDFYSTNWVAGKVVDIIPADMTREWRSFIGEIEPQSVKKLEEEEERLQLSTTFNDAHKWARLYGTGFIVLAVDDGQTPDKPLDINKIKKGGLQHIKAIDRQRVSTAEVVPIQDPLNANFGMPEFYRFNETSIKIHHSRVLRFDAIQLPFEEFRRNNYFSNSVLDRLYESILNLDTVTNSAASMVFNTNVDVVKVDNLMNYIMTPAKEDTLKKRFALAAQLKSFNNIMLLDTKEDIIKMSNTFAGLPDLIDRYSRIVTAGTDIPATRLLGDSASGMNATGEGDLKNYYDMLRAAQINIYKPKLDYFDAIMAKSMGLGEDVDLSYEFNSLFQMSDQEQANLEKSNAERDAMYLDRGVITEEIVAKELQQEGTYTNITDEYIQELENQENALVPTEFELESEEKEEEPESSPGEDSEEPGS